MDDIKKIVEELRNYPVYIHLATIVAEDLRMEWGAIKARRDYEFAGAFLKAKATDFTDGESRQKATIDVYGTDKEALVAESAYRKAAADMAKMENEFAAVRKNVGLQEAVILKLGHPLAEM